MFNTETTYLPEGMENLEGFRPEPGRIYEGLPIDLYHSSNGESSTGFKRILSTVQNYLDKDEETPCKRLGHHFHTALELKQAGKRFEDAYGAFDYMRNRKEPTAEFILEHYENIHGNPYGKTLTQMKNMLLPSLNKVADELEAKLLNGKKRIPFKDFDYCGRMVNALLEHPRASMLLAAPGKAELSFFSDEKVKTENAGVAILVKVRVDWLIECPEEVWIFDWKSIGKPVTTRNMQYAVRDLDYDLSAYMYKRVIEKFTGKPVVFRWVFVESKRPHKTRVRIKRISEKQLEQGEYKYRKALKKMAGYIQNPDQWTGYDDAFDLDTTLDD